MEYRRIGKTDIEASVIGLGCEGLLNKSDADFDAVIGAAMEGGVNIVDFFTPNRTTRVQLGRALKGRRGKMHIQAHIGSTDIHEQNDVSRDLAVCKKYFESFYEDLGTDYLDFGMFFFIDTADDFHAAFEGELLEYGLKLKRQGRVRALGASCHNSVIAKRIAETGVVDVIMFSVNPAFDMTPPESDIYKMLDEEKKLNENFDLRIEPERAALYRVCAEREVSITVMKTLGAGRLLSAELSPFGKAMSLGQCVNYALSRPAVASVMLGAASVKEVNEALAYFGLSDKEKDYSGILKSFPGATAGNCMYCNHCQPCPASIDIAAITKYKDIAALAAAKGEPIPPTVAQHYASLAQHGSDCFGLRSNQECGSCEERCPFGVKVRENMACAAELFGTYALPS